jgi:hypothetical protein
MSGTSMISAATKIHFTAVFLSLPQKKASLIEYLMLAARAARNRGVVAWCPSVPV